MDNLLKSVDIAQVEIHEQAVYYIEGWAIPEPEQSFRLEIRFDGEVVPAEVKFRERPDLGNVLKETKIPEKPGFSIYVPEIRSLMEKYHKMALYLVGSDTEELLFEKNTEKIKEEYYNQTVVYKVEALEQRGDIMMIQGWGFDLETISQISIQVKDEKGEPQKFAVERVVRLDVNKAYGITDDKLKCGFSITMRRKTIHAKVLSIVFSNGYASKKYGIEMKKFDAAYSKWGRLKKALGEKEENKKRIREKGYRGFLRYLEYRMDPWFADYTMWMQERMASKRELFAQNRVKFPYEPLISIVIPLYNTPEKFLGELMDSLTGQSYHNIEICLADGSSEDRVGKYIRRKYGRDSRVKYKRLEKNGGISENTNAAVAMASGDFIMLSDHDDVVARDAVYEIVKAINEDPERTDIVYTDEDKVTMNGKKYFEPNLKPDFDLDLLRSNNYICHIFVVRKAIMDEIGGFRPEYDGAQDFDLILRCSEKADRIAHVPKVLYHWRSHPASTAENPGSKQYAFDAGRKALQEHYNRLGIKAEAECTNIFGRYRTHYAVQGQPKVSIIIPNKDHIEDLKTCVNSVLEKTAYPNYEILIVENNSTEPETFKWYEETEKKEPKVRVITWKEGFNYAAINNFAVKSCDGEHLLFLNNDTEIITENWIQEMLGYSQREDVGAVGAKLYYPDDTVQHAGVVIGLGGIAGHIFSCMPRETYGYQARLISAQDYSAVTAACMMMRRDVFEAVGGFDEKFQVAFNDVDLCMKVRAADKLVVFTPYAELYHYESKSRGKEETARQVQRFHGEIARFKEKWPDILKNGDPYYNPNLSLTDGDCSLRKDEA